jgi:hypothetical protein
MADTSYLRYKVEPFVRDRLTERFAQIFRSKSVSLTTGGTHEFDAVSEDGSIVVGIKAASGLTSGGRVPSGKLNNAIAELYYLSLVDAPTRILVLTTPSFYALMIKKVKGALIPGIQIECIELSPEMQAEVDKVVKAASAEVSPLAVSESDLQV